MKSVIPEKARTQASKIVPEPLYFAALRGPGQAVARDLLRASKLEALGLVDGAKLQASFERFLAGEAWQHELWWPLTGEWWLRSYWDQSEG